MSIRLIEYDRNTKTVQPTEHCYQIVWLKRLIDMFQEDEEYLTVLAYVFYMSCPTPENPFFNVKEVDREIKICRSLQPEFDREDLAILDAIDKLKELYTTPIMRSYDAMATMVDNLNEYIKTTEITDGKDGNIGPLLRVLKDFKQVRDSYQDILKDVEEETKVKGRGQSRIPYDQRS